MSIQNSAGNRQRGFSFTEIMFAVVILGIGFIMVAAIFPVALQQSKATSEETTAASIARGASGYLAQVLVDGAAPGNTPSSTANCPPSVLNTATVSMVTHPIVNLTALAAPAPPPLWASLANNLVLPEDPRYAWVMLYRRNGELLKPSTWSPYVQVYLFPVEVRATDIFDPVKDTTPIPSGASNPAAVANLSAKPVLICVAEGTEITGFVDVIAFDITANGASAGASPNQTDNAEAAAIGAYVVVANDKISGLDQGRMNGQIYKLGSRRTDLDGEFGLFYNTSMSRMQVYELQPGSDFKADPGINGIPGDSDDILGIGNTQPVPAPAPASPSTVVATGSADAYVIGRGFTPGITTSPPTYENVSMPISAYTTFIKVK